MNKRKEIKLKKLAEEQVVYMLLHNGEQSEEIWNKFKEAKKGVDYPYLIWWEVIGEFSRNEAIKEELERMHAKECWV